MKAVKVKCYIWKRKHTATYANTISIVYFLEARSFTKTYSRTITIHRGIFPGWALQELSADCCPDSGNLMFLKQIFISETKTLYCLYFSPLNFLPRLFKNQLNFFNFLRWKPWEKNTKFENENWQNPVHTILIVCFRQTRLFTEHFLRTTIHRVFSADGHYGLTVGSLSNDDDDAEDDAK